MAAPRPGAAGQKPAPGHDGKLAFWIHQLTEYLFGIMIVSQAITSPSPAVPILVGLAVVAMAATAEGPAAVWPIVPRPVHRIVDIVAIVAFLLVAVLFRNAMGALGVLLTVAAAVVLAFLMWRTDYRPRPERRRRSRPADDTPASSAPATPTTPTTPVNAEDVGRAAGRLVGKGVNAYRRRKGGTR